ncbi:MAG: hypothetical protein HN534_02975 [Euryarchaeota archaeon]|jgi:hypothetical protein|nr:hypothetical protein [Euryarchaeota archaeon]MBT3653877.1 hypothetical protein [Euryarchaeota archaeon]MBT3757281.1 hypothetical protein [Euryarchaeota archaeon]MBT4050744.1 hypothetical protein [Euryarchaeota archaeon]MBT4346339.1 hypothetical protein [Euryarchaeota archaeon]|tara:strand:- start:3352 stop:3816 length:465 start_codon:yes stop_codon:yes gene_type:complete
MDWVTQDIALPSQELSIPSLVKSSLGFDVTAAEMHDQFLTDLPHSEIIVNHQNVISDVLTPIESAKMNIREIMPLDEMLREFNGDKDEVGIRLELPSASPTEIIIKTMIDENQQIVRVLVPERFGGLLRTFRMPIDKEISTISWEDGILSLMMD